MAISETIVDNWRGRSDYQEDSISPITMAWSRI